MKETMEEFCGSVDWKKFKKQKETFVSFLNDHTISKEQKKDFLGLLDVLDVLQDIAGEEEDDES